MFSHRFPEATLNAFYLCALIWIYISHFVLQSARISFSNLLRAPMNVERECHWHPSPWIHNNERGTSFVSED